MSPDPQTEPSATAAYPAAPMPSKPAENEAYARYCRPALGRLLESVGLNAVYVRGLGDRLFRRVERGSVETLDLAGGFGANLFGHNHPDLVAEQRRLLDEGTAFLAQGSCRGGAALLAQALCEQVGDYVVTFTNSGAETIEAAMKHARLESGKRVFWAVRNAFHGKTSGAVQLTWNYRGPYTDWGPEIHFLDPQQPEQWAAMERNASDVAAAFVEPIQGEGGIHPLPEPFATWLSGCSRRKGFPLVVDEIQTGMGRTGTFLASTQFGLRPDYLCLSKALGGGLVKIGALMIKRERFVDEFSVQHSSTFAEDDPGCLVALKALEILRRDRIPERCAMQGRLLTSKLEDLRARFPKQIREVRGRGLMIGVELQDQSESRSNVLRMLSQQGCLGYMAAGYLLNVHDIRIGPTLSQPFTLRVEPSAYIESAELDRFVEALRRLCQALEAADAAHLTGFQVGRPDLPVLRAGRPRALTRERPRTHHRVAFIGHCLLAEHAQLWDASLHRLGANELGRYIEKISRVLGPTVFDQVNVRSITGDEVHLSFIGLCLTSGQIARARLQRDQAWIHEKIEAAVRLARDEGCQVAGLGGFTSILTSNCLTIRTPGIALTSGNSLTVGMGIEALQSAAERKGIELARASLAVVGATGNIGAAFATIMAPRVAELVLVVRNQAAPRLKTVLSHLRGSAPGIPFRISEDIAAIEDCALVVSASNCPTPLIHPRHLGSGPVAICDISVPANVSDAVGLAKPNVAVIQGGIVRLPFNDDFVIGGIPLAPGHVYACMAETMLMGLEGTEAHGSFGRIAADRVLRMMALADRHGFRLGQMKTARAC